MYNLPYSNYILMTSLRPLYFLLRGNHDVLEEDLTPHGKNTAAETMATNAVAR